MRRYFAYDEQTKTKVLIPGCYGSLHREDLSNCCCPKREKSLKQFEKEEYNKRVNELTNEVEYLIKENNALIRIIEKINRATS